MKFEDIVTVRIERNLARENEGSNQTLVAYLFVNLVLIEEIQIINTVI
ncbi:type I restriction endonuclease subunit S [Bacillus tropicus]|nr:type I restriction endonuclease subunit S [Bacillus thuringiensis]EEM24029.1 Type I restriction-modification system specificity subunit [Bacillus thuringiensis serovar tochigiensis BGSC 4Y1]MCB4846866.1 type I restriction endonuclease subunit S [Bacillus tropicus]UBM52277.1 type I restriction endonuclease subunit S [Bacillus sp. CRB-7]